MAARRFRSLFWAAEAQLGRERGIFPIAKAMRVEYGKLKQRVHASGAMVFRICGNPGGFHGFSKTV